MKYGSGLKMSERVIMFVGTVKNMCPPVYMLSIFKYDGGKDVPRSPLMSEKKQIVEGGRRRKEWNIKGSQMKGDKLFCHRNEPLSSIFAAAGARCTLHVCYVQL